MKIFLIRLLAIIPAFMVTATTIGLWVSSFVIDWRLIFLGIANFWAMIIVLAHNEDMVENLKELFRIIEDETTTDEICL